MKVTNRVDERLVDLAAALSVVTMQGREPVAKMVADELAEAFGGAALAFRTMPAAKGWEVDFYYGKDVRRDAGPGLPDQIRSRLDPYLPTAPTRWSTYDALRPEPAQRDLVFGPREMQAIYESGNSPIVRVIYEPLGLTTVPHMRVLVCDGPFLLGWFGLWRQEPLSRTDTHRLAHLVAPLRRRLRIERMLDGSISVEGVARALEAIDIST